MSQGELVFRTAAGLEQWQNNLPKTFKKMNSVSSAYEASIHDKNTNGKL